MICGRFCIRRPNRSCRDVFLLILHLAEMGAVQFTSNAELLPTIVAIAVEAEVWHFAETGRVQKAGENQISCSCRSC
jgi:hypothetical protein